MNVEITLTEYAKTSAAVRTAALEAFGDRLGRHLREGGPTRVKCTPEQLATFLVARDTYGGSNGWKELNARIVDVEKKRKTGIVDVTPFATIDQPEYTELAQQNYYLPLKKDQMVPNGYKAKNYLTKNEFVMLPDNSVTTLKRWVKSRDDRFMAEVISSNVRYYPEELVPLERV